MAGCKRARKARAYRGTPEGAVLRLVQDYLLARRILFFRMNTGAIPSSYKGRTRLIRFGSPGMADIIAFPVTKRVMGLGLVIKPLWIEVKAPNGEQTPQQISFQKIVEDNGHSYLVARGIEPIEAWLKENC